MEAEEVSSGFVRLPSFGRVKGGTNTLHTVLELKGKSNFFCNDTKYVFLYIYIKRYIYSTRFHHCEERNRKLLVDGVKR